MKYRYEEKYLINNLQIEILKNTLGCIMQKDENINSEEGSYFIRSLYFDDYKNTSYFQVLDGLGIREKYRVRYYNYDKSYMILEKKSKTNNLGNKIKDKLTEKEVEMLCDEIPFDSSKKVLGELCRNIKTKLYKPVVIIDYMRMAFVFPINDVRITIDFNISCSNEFSKFFCKNLNSIPLLEKNHAILEVKYNDYLPDLIKNIIYKNNLQKMSFSKYSNGRRMLEKIEGSV